MIWLRRVFCFSLVSRRVRPPLTVLPVKVRSIPGRSFPDCTEEPQTHVGECDAVRTARGVEWLSSGALLFPALIERRGPMQPDRWLQVQDVIADVLDVAPADRVAAPRYCLL